MDLLVVFDFDWSLVNENTDTWVLQASEDVKKWVQEEYKSGKYTGQFTKLVDDAMGKMHEANVTKSDLEKLLKDIPFDQALIKQLRELKDKGAELRIVSDSNTFYIDTILKHHGLEDMFTEVVTNPGQFDDAGRLRIKPYLPEPHSCERCSSCPNMCKGAIVRGYLETLNPTRIIYVGDGHNDFCAACNLRKNDVVFARADYSLNKALLAAPHPKPDVPFGVWRSYEELVFLLKGQKAKPTFEIRQMTPEDWPAVAEIFQHGIDMGNATFATEPPSWEEWDGNHVQDPRLVAMAGDKMLGWTALSPVSKRVIYRGVVEISVYVSASSRGLGLGKALVNEMIARSEAAGIWTLEARMVRENTACVRLHEACGFRMVGWREKLGKLRGEWRDAVILERRSPSIL